MLSKRVLPYTYAKYFPEIKITYVYERRLKPKTDTSPRLLVNLKPRAGGGVTSGRGESRKIGNVNIF